MPKLSLRSRYLPPSIIDSLTDDLHLNGSVVKTMLGKSVLGKAIYSLKFGEGPFCILIWSQMHGNETTTTKSLLHFFRELKSDPALVALSNKVTVHCIPVLNPDGAEAYTRENANEIDLNRDAQALTQPESLILRNMYEAVKPDLCLNMHGQRSIYGLTGTENPAIVSFLAPAADEDRSVTPARLKAMHYINIISLSLTEDIGNCIGRYDDSYNAACVGDSFTTNGTPTILFEAGQYDLDYQRNNTAALLLKALKALFNYVASGKEDLDDDTIQDQYLRLPENNISFYDLIIKDALPGKAPNKGDVAVQFKETLKRKKIVFEAQVAEIGRLARPNAHQVVNNKKLHSKLSKINESEWLDFIEKYVLKNFSR